MLSAEVALFSEITKVEINPCLNFSENGYTSAAILLLQ